MDDVDEPAEQHEQEETEAAESLFNELVQRIVGPPLLATQKKIDERGDQSENSLNQLKSRLSQATSDLEETIDSRFGGVESIVGHLADSGLHTQTSIDGLNEQLGELDGRITAVIAEHREESRALLGSAVVELSRQLHEVQARIESLSQSQLESSASLNAALDQHSKNTSQMTRTAANQTVAAIEPRLEALELDTASALGQLETVRGKNEHARIEAAETAAAAQGQVEALQTELELWSKATRRGAIAIGSGVAVIFLMLVALLFLAITSRG